MLQAISVRRCVGRAHFVADGRDVWVANSGNNTVTELSASTGGLLQVLSASSLGFDDPVAISSDGARVWVANSANSTVTEMSALSGTGGVLSGSSFGFDDPVSISSDGTDEFVANAGNNSVTVLELGENPEVLSGSTYQFDDPDGVFSDGTFVWIANAGNNSVTVLTTPDIELAGVWSVPLYGLDHPVAVCADGPEGNVWVVNTDQSVTGHPA